MRVRPGATFIFPGANNQAMKWSVFLYSPYGRRPDYNRDYPPQYYPPPPGYYYQYPPINPYDAAYNANEADKLARWIWMLVAILIVGAVAGVIAFAIFLSSNSTGVVILPPGLLVPVARAARGPPNF